jgi:hypothetical protein
MPPRTCHRPPHARALGVLTFLGLLALGLTGGRQPAAGQAAQDAAATRPLRAGAATSNITPRLGRAIVGGWNQPRASHIHDELHARCLVLDDGATRLAFVVCDNVGIDRQVFDEAKRLVHKETGIPMEHQLMSATHTHSGPSWHGRDDGDADYPHFLARRIADGVRRAVRNLEPARLGWGVGQETNEVFNRRWKMKPGTPLPNPFGGTDRVRMNPGVGNPDVLEPAGPTDPEIAFLTVQALDGRPIALLANYSLHYVGGGRPEEMSADYFALFADRIQQLLGADRLDPPFVGILANGTSGDVNNINVRGPRQQLPPYAKMRQVADRVAAEVFKVHRSVRFHDRVALAARQKELSLATRKPTPELVARAKEILARPDGAPQGHIRERHYAQRTLVLDQAPPRTEILLQAFQVGDVGIAAIPFEVFAETGLEIKRRSPFKPSFTISLANGANGYLPTPEQHQLGGYETWLGTNRVETEASVKIIETLMDLFGRLRRPPGGD